MAHIVVNDQQAKIISDSPDCIEILDQSGKHLGYVAHGFTDEDIVSAKERMTSDEPRYSTQEVLNHIDSLEQK